MTLHSGQAYREGDVSIGPPDLAALRTAANSSDIHSEVERWTRVGEQEEGAHHFAVHYGESLAGHVFLHDIDRAARSALVGYHLFEPFRGQGIGTVALRLLQAFVSAETNLRTLVVITSGDNLASRRIAEKCGFVHIGPPREDLTGVCLQWHCR